MQAGDVSMRFCALGLKGISSIFLGLGLRLEQHPELCAGFRPERGEVLLVFTTAFETVAGAVLGRCEMP